MVFFQKEKQKSLDNLFFMDLKEEISNENVYVSQTPGSNDGGKDIIIESYKDIKLFGINFNLIS